MMNTPKLNKPRMPPLVRGDTSHNERLIFSGPNSFAKETPPFAVGEPPVEMSMEMRRARKELEDYMRSRRRLVEEKMFEKFYLMRIEQSRKFIDLIRKINTSWDNFVDCLKSIGSQGASGDGDCTVYSLANSSSTAVSGASINSK